MQIIALVIGNGQSPKCRFVGLGIQTSKQAVIDQDWVLKQRMIPERLASYRIGSIRSQNSKGTLRAR